jgi:hypothetical protein
LFAVGSDHGQFAERLARALKHAESLGENTVVVAEKNAHRKSDRTRAA